MNEQSQGADTYIQELKEVLDGLDLDKIKQAVAMLKMSVFTDVVVYTCGNGGSAATASHLVCDLVKNASWGIQAFCLNDNIPLVTAFSNDVEYNKVFIEILSRLQPGILVAISTSGNSENVLKAAGITKGSARPVIALTGRDGGKLGKIADIEIRVPSDRIQIIEDVHLSICHMIAVGLGA